MSDSEDRSFKARDVTGAVVVTGGKNTVHANISVSLPPASEVDIKAEINALKRDFEALGGDDQRKIRRALEDAEEEIAKPEPDKNEVGAAIKRAAEYAKQASDFGEHAEKIGKRLAPIVSWLGDNWAPILTAIGITIT